MPLDPGDRLGPYEIAAQLGVGAMGEVYRARDTRLDRTVAIKVLSADVAADPGFRERFDREARVASSLNHPNICTLYDIGREHDVDFLVMECLEGETLAARLTRGPLPLSDAVRHTLGILSALGAVHERGIIHRDLKPSNLFMTAHGIKLLDFGVARPPSGEESKTAAALTLAGMVVGTPQYMAPEALFSEAVDNRADLFAVGAILFESLTGKPPFAGDSLAAIIHSVTHDTPPALSGSDAITSVDRVIHKALAKRPEERPDTAEAMAQTLRQITLTGTDRTRREVARTMTRLVVLPFRVLRPDPDTDFLAFSLPDAITASLSGLASLVVRSSAVASQFSSHTPDLKAIATTADVDVVLTGSLLRDGDRLRVSTQLLEVPAGTVIWSHDTQATMGDLFQLQDGLTQGIVDSLSLPLTAREHAQLKRDMPASAKAYEYYLRANQLADQGRDWGRARALYQRCLDADPHYAPAWARLGHVYRMLAKWLDEEREANYARAEEAFKRALDLNSGLGLAHNLYAYLEVEIGRTTEAMLRLVSQAQRQASSPELFTGLVQSCRYCGLLNASIAAHECARRLDTKSQTSVQHSYFLAGDYERALAFDTHASRILRGLALLMLGRDREAADSLRQSEQWATGKKLYTLMIATFRSLAEGRQTESITAMDAYTAAMRDPEALYYMSRVAAKCGETERSLQILVRVVDGGFCCYPAFRDDPWLEPLRGHPEFERLLGIAETRHHAAAAAFAAAGGQQVLGMGPDP